MDLVFLLIQEQVLQQLLLVMVVLLNLNLLLLKTEVMQVVGLLIIMELEQLDYTIQIKHH